MRDANVVNVPEVVAEVIDGELVAIHLGSGCYYHANKSGSMIWNFLENKLPTSEIVSNFSKVFSLGVDKSTVVVNKFVKMLLREKLIRRLKEDEVGRSYKSKLPKKMAYEVPTLKKHTDMKELLLLDPIHDIGDNPIPLKTVE